CRRNKGSRDGKTEANRALIFRGNRRDAGRRTVAGPAEDGLCQVRGTSVSPTLADFMDMPDREPKLQRQSQQRKPRAAAPRYRGNALDHSPVYLGVAHSSAHLTQQLSRRAASCATEIAA